MRSDEPVLSAFGGLGDTLAVHGDGPATSICEAVVKTCLPTKGARPQSLSEQSTSVPSRPVCTTPCAHCIFKGRSR
eukprot:scaffold315233_cov26-Tisochrysis_lutea.AAC.1